MDNCNSLNKDLEKINIDPKKQNGFSYKKSSDSINDEKIKSKKRTEDVLEWHEYFMASAFLVAKRSKDPVTRVGCVIVNDENKIVGTGYNGMPNGCSDDDFPWDKNTQDILDSKYLYVCHAEMNAINNKNSSDVKNCRVYTSHFPCNECAKSIIQCGIREVIYMFDKNANTPSVIASKRMFNAAKVVYWQFKPVHEIITIDMTPEANIRSDKLPKKVS